MEKALSSSIISSDAGSQPPHQRLTFELPGSQKVGTTWGCLFDMLVQSMISLWKVHVQKTCRGSTYH